MLHLLAAKPPSIGRHNGNVACRQAREPREKNLVSQLCLIGILQCLIVHILVIGSSPSRWYKYLFLSIYLPQSSVTSLVASLALCSIVY